MDTLLPWHESLWRRVLRAWRYNRLPHALLLQGPVGMGKALFAQRLASILLCQHLQIEKRPCEQCKSCHLLRIGHHPDLMSVQPMEGGKQIQVEQIRTLIQFCALTPNYDHQIIIINPAESMNHNAANSLLKLLEEPPDETFIMLVSHQSGHLLATLRSRCQHLDFRRPDKKVALTWLQDNISSEFNAELLLNLCMQAPLSALTLAKAEKMSKRQVVFDNLGALIMARIDPVRIAEMWDKLGAIQTLIWLLSWTMDLIRYTATGQAQYIVNQDYREVLQNLAQSLELQTLFNLLDLQQDAYQLMKGTTHVKSQGLLESVALKWFELGKREKL